MANKFEVNAFNDRTDAQVCIGTCNNKTEAMALIDEQIGGADWLIQISPVGGCRVVDSWVHVDEEEREGNLWIPAGW